MTFVSLFTTWLVKITIAPISLRRVFCLIGLIGWGSIPHHIICLGGLLIFIALWALAYAVELSTSNKKENHMKTVNFETKSTKTNDTKLAAKSLALTLLVTVTSIWSGALSGKALDLSF